MFERYFSWDNNVQDWTDNVIQLAVINAIRTEAMYFNQAWGGSGAGESVMEKKVGEGWIYTAKLFNKIVLIIRQLAEALVYTSAIFLPVLIAVSGLKYLFTFVKMNMWLQLWIPIFVILNAFADKQLNSVLSAAMNNPAIANGNNGISFANIEWIRTHANLILGYIGAFSWSVPTLSWALLQGGEHAMRGAVGAITGGAGGQGVAQGVGSEVGGGAKPQMAPILQNPTLDNVRNAYNSAVDIPRMTGQNVAASDFGSKFMEKYAQLPYYDGAGRMDAVGGNLGKLRETSAISTERQVADQAAFAEEARSRGSSVPELQKSFAEMDYGAKAQVIQDWQQKNGGTTDEAAHSLAALTGDRHFVEAAKFMGGREAVGGVQNLADLQESGGKIESSSLYSAVKTIQGHGFKVEDFGGIKGFDEAARTIGLMQDLKGGKLTKDEVVAAQATGFLTQAGRAQGIERAAAGLGMNPKELSEKVAGWENMNEFIKFNEMQKFADSRGIDLPQLMSAHHRGTEVSVSDEEAGKLGLPGAGQYRMAWNQDQGYVFYQQRGGEDRQVGTFGKFGNVQESLHKSVEDSQDVSKAGVLISRGTEISDKTAFEMARNGDPELVRMVTNPYLGEKERDTQIGVLARSVGSAISTFIDRKGVSGDYSKGSADVSIGGSFIASGHVGGGIGGERMDRITTDLRVQESDALIREVLTSAKDQNLSPSETRSHLSEALADKVDAAYLEARNNSPDKFGAAAPGNLIKKYLKDGAKELGKSMIESPEFHGPK